MKGCISLPLLFDAVSLFRPASQHFDASMCSLRNFQSAQVSCQAMHVSSSRAGQGLAVTVLDSRSLKVEI